MSPCTKCKKRGTDKCRYKSCKPRKDYERGQSKSEKCRIQHGLC